MIDQPKTARLAREAFDQWRAGRLEQSSQLYEEAIPLADPKHYGLPSYHGEYACVLNALGRHDDATVEMEKSLAIEIDQGHAEGSIAVLIARYFLADQLRRRGDNERALAALSLSLRHAPTDWLTRVAEAHILYALNRRVEARDAATLAIEYAPSLEKADELRENLREVFGRREA